MVKNFVLFGAGLFILAFGLAAIGCGDDDKTQEESTADLCGKLAEYDDAVAELEATLSTPPITVGDVEDGIAAVQDAWNAVAGARGDLAEARFTAVEDAQDTLAGAIDDVEDDATLAQAAASILDEVAAVVTSEQAIGTEAGC